MLRKQVPETQSTYTDPVLGVNLNSAEEDLRGGEARLMQNLVYRSGTRMRLGNSRITASSLGASLRVRGGHKYYYGGSSPAKKRLIAYSTKISSISDAGAETVINSGMTSDLDTFFTTWSITDIVYIANATDTLRQYDGTTFSTVTGTAIPVARTGVCPILDRLLCITTNGIERTNPRVATTWSSNSSWATFRPSLVGLFTALHPFTLKGPDTLYPGAIAFQANAYYVITGSDFGSDVTSGTASAGEDAAIQLLDPSVGTSSPYSVCTVPGLGIFWFTSDLNVYWLPEGSLVGQYIGDKIYSTGSTTGIESTNKGAIGQVWMQHFDRYLRLAVPTGSNTWCDKQFWLDLKSLKENPRRGPVWYGPMTGGTYSRCWREDQQGELKIVAGEGNPTTGVFVYEVDPAGRFKDATGTTDTNITSVYQTPFPSFGTPSREKYIKAVNAELRNFTGTPTVELLDLDGSIVSGLSLTAV